MRELADHEYGRAELEDGAFVVRQHPLLSPLVQPLRVALKQPDTGVACRVAWELELVKRHAPRVDEVEIPLEQPRVVVRAAAAARAPRQVEASSRCRRFLPATADG